MRILILLFSSCLAVSLGAQRISVAELESWLGDKENRPVLIDIRSAHDFAEGRIPGAINLPAKGLANRRLPPFGRVVLYGSGLGRYDEAGALAAMAEKPGIDPYLLNGGFAAWATGGRAVAGKSGLQPERPPMLTYNEAMATLPPDAVIVDIRPPSAAPPGESGSFAPAASAADPVADWATAVGRPLRRGLGSAAAPGTFGPVGGAAVNDELIVIVDDDAMRAERTARRLRAQGQTRVVVLVGGVEAILFEGKSGRVRAGTGITGEGTLDEIEF
ncbi:MAG: hypothetical protein JJU00_04205 [Opitutales bacterium]|nr:hypothetical protein [Opitutales bacterium]